MGRFYDATYGRLFAAGYDWMLGDCERAGLADLRRDLVARAAGATVEVGAGTGLNLSYYPDTVTELVLTELRHGATAAGPVHRSGPVGGGGRGLGRAVAVRRGVVRHRGGHPRAVHGARGGGGARRDQAGAPPGRSAARSRACPLRRSTARPLAGPLGASVAAARRRLSLQPRHRGRDRRGRVQPGVEPCWGDAEGPTDRPAADLSGGPPRAGACWRSWARRRRSALRAALTRPSAGGARVGCGRRTAMSGRRIAVAGAACAAGVRGTWLMLADNVEQANSPNVLGLAAVWSFVVSGLVVWHRQPDNRIGPIMVATGLARVAYEFMWVRQPVLATAGHVLAGAHIAGAAFVLLGFPTGRLGSTFNRVLFAGVVVVVGPLQVAWLLAGGHSLSGSCRGCGPNLLEVTRNAALAQVLMGAQHGLGVVVVALTVAVLVRRWRQASPRLRFAIAPMLWTGAVAFLALLLWVADDALGTPIAGTETLLSLVLVVVPISFLVGLARVHLGRSGVADLVVRLGETPEPGELRAARPDPHRRLLAAQPRAARRRDRPAGVAAGRGRGEGGDADRAGGPTDRRAGARSGAG